MQRDLLSARAHLGAKAMATINLRRGLKRLSLMARARSLLVLRGIALIVALTINGEMAFAQNDKTSANFIMPGCRASIGPALRQGRCSGIVEGFVFAGKGVDVCAPNAVTTEQAVRIVVQYIDKRPARINDDFRRLALEALRAAWPCKK